MDMQDQLSYDRGIFGQNNSAPKIQRIKAGATQNISSKSDGGDRGLTVDFWYKTRVFEIEGIVKSKISRRNDLFIQVLFCFTQSPSFSCWLICNNMYVFAKITIIRMVQS